MIMDWVLFRAILFIWLNSIDWVFVLVNWNVHIVSMFSISRTAQGSTNAPCPRFAHLFLPWMMKPIRGTLDLPNVCFSSLSRRGDWLIDVSVEQFFIRTCFEVVVPFESEKPWDSGENFKKCSHIGIRLVSFRYTESRSVAHFATFSVSNWDFQYRQTVGKKWGKKVIVLPELSFG